MPRYGQTEHRHMTKCFLCQGEFQYGPHVYEGWRCPEWNIMVCRPCYLGNDDGIVPGSYPHLEQHLRSIGAGAGLNRAGWIAWPSKPIWAPFSSVRAR